MDDEKKVTNIDEARAKSGAAAHARGEAFALERYEFDDEHVGIAVYDEHAKEMGVSVLTDGLTGIVMSKGDATKLGVRLIQAAGVATFLEASKDDE